MHDSRRPASAIRVTHDDLTTIKYIKNQKPPPPHHQDDMLRKGIRPPPVDLHRLFDTLKSLRNVRNSPLMELPPPAETQETTARAESKKWESVEAMEAEDVLNDDEPSIRIFRQDIEPPRLLKQSLESLDATSGSPILDAATGLDKGVASTKGLSKVELHQLRNFTNALNFVSHSPLSVSKEVFHLLDQFKANPKVLQLLTPRAWELLWALEVNTVPSYRSRLIGEMMTSAGVPMSEEQEIAYIGGMFWNDAKEIALKSWVEGTRIGKASHAFWNVGIRMYSIDLKPEMAEYWIQQMTKALGRAEPKDWIPIIMAYNQIYQPRRAWHAYNEMCRWSKHTKKPITLSQYDNICMSFLDGGGSTLGLEVYKHMVYSGPPALERIKTQFYSALTPAILAAQNSAQSPQQLNDLSMDALKNLPPKVADKYFYGSWMKNLIRMGRTDLAWYLVRDVMVKRGFMPDSIHLDWIVQGFLEEDNTRMAEEVANEMFRERLSRVTAKRDCPPFVDWSAASSATIPTPNLPTTASTPPTLTPGPIAPATIQTFSLLINHATRRQRMDLVVSLTTLMARCEIDANSYIFNHLMYGLLRTHDLPRLSRTFTILLSTATSQPDLQTWHILWMAQWRRHTQPHLKSGEFDQPRALFATMVKRLPRRMVKEEEGKDRMLDLWVIVVRCFGLAGDLPGMLVALHAGKIVWGVSVDDRVVKEVTLGVFKGRRRYLKATEGVNIPVEKVTVEGGVRELQILGRKLLDRRRRGRVKLNWKSVRDPEGLLEGLTSFLRWEMREGSGVGEGLIMAKVEMGVEELVVG